ncbi:hypothetical protein POVWA2_027220 [Plasmodium ovale wallikeri]|uniref:Uncharacterized protein n=1 Tax=Plasmodium ovale wallikeri TaxID=864142 RepID=A0A1A8YWR1_PLAOA|nr:hypothetical protein POVWA2_027220 [Plasmodium ovale wallikeri]
MKRGKEPAKLACPHSGVPVRVRKVHLKNWHKIFKVRYEEDFIRASCEEKHVYHMMGKKKKKKKKGLQQQL